MAELWLMVLLNTGDTWQVEQAKGDVVLIQAQGWHRGG